MTRALVIGGTGPTGIPLVRDLVSRGYDVTIVHRGLHERAETPPDVVHLHTDPYDDDSLRQLFDPAPFGRERFDVVVAMYGRLRRIAELATGQVGQFVSVGGVPAYLGWMNPWATDPPGLPVPIGEDAPTVERVGDDEKGYRIVRTERVVFTHHPHAAHFRYPYVYGPHQLVPREWLVVRRILDGRERIVLADDGLTLHHHGYTENLADALVLAMEQPEAAAGKIFNVGDEEVLSIRQVVDLIASALGRRLDIVSMPFELAVPACPLLAQPSPAHRVLDINRVRNDLGYHDVVAARAAIAATAHWLVDNPCPRDGQEELVLTDPFDYAAEDRLIDVWTRSVTAMPDAGFATMPGYGLAYSGPGGRPRSNEEFDA